ncbi:MAG: hypothetical protein JF616_09825 [Fibrobacteres bacterium]|nr:hypothetical protein [Fibrobacterota bacterium]
MSTFGLYMLGFVMIIGGLAYGALRLGAPQVWVIIGAVILLGLGIASGASQTRRRDASDA